MHKIRFLLLVTMIVFSAGIMQAQEEGQSGTFIYQNEMMSESEMVARSEGEIFCNQVITRVVIERGYFDGRVDNFACFDSELEMLSQVTTNDQTIRELSHLQPQQLNETQLPIEPITRSSGSCAGDDRGTAYLDVLYQSSHGDVCNDYTRRGLGGNGWIRSIWLVEEPSDPTTSSPKIRIVQNTWPTKKVTIVNYSSAFLGFNNVYEYTWRP